MGVFVEILFLISSESAVAVPKKVDRRNEMERVLEAMDKVDSPGYFLIGLKM